MPPEESLLTDQAITDAGTQNAEGDAAQLATQQSPDVTKPAEGQQGDKPKADESETQAPVVPEKYEFQMPEGVDLDAEMADEFSGYAKEMKLSQEQAQQIAGVGAKMMLKVHESYQAAYVQQQEEWQTAARTDSEFGGVNLQQNLAVAAKAIDFAGGEKLREVLKATGMGNQPEIIRAFVRLGKAISEDRLVTGGRQTPGSSQPVEARLYPNEYGKKR